MFLPGSKHIDIPGLLFTAPLVILRFHTAVYAHETFYTISVAHSSSCSLESHEDSGMLSMEWVEVT